MESRRPHFHSLLFPLFLLCGLIAVVSGQDHQESTIRKLRKHLLTGYDVSARPVRNHENITIVEIAFFPEHVTCLNEKRAILTLEAWAYMGWRDDHLQWNPTEFDGIEVLHLPDKEIWKPDISVMEGRGSKIDPWHSVNLEVNSTGYVRWYPSATLDVICAELDYTGYPEDVQTCTVTLGSWASDSSHIDIMLHSSMDSLEEYLPSNPMWDVVSAMGKRDEKLYEEGYVEPFVFAEFELKLKRQKVQHSALSAAPDTVARVLVLCMFWLSSPLRKMALACTALLIFTGVAVGITENLPSPAAAPYALYRVSSAMALTVAALIVEMAITTMAGLTFCLPSWLDNIYGSTVCLMLRPTEQDLEKQKSDKVDIVDNSSELRKTPQWSVIAASLDRILSVVFLVLFFSI